MISNDCWGAEVYRHFDLAYHTPFVGLFMMAPCYIKLLQNLPQFLSSPLTFQKHSKYPEMEAFRASREKQYPIGLLDGEVEVHFLHYQSWEQAQETWSKRVDRVNYNNLFVKFDASKDGANRDLAKTFSQLPFKNKIILSKEYIPDIPYSLHIKGWVSDGAKMYKLSLRELNIISWLNGGSYKNRFLDKLAWWLFIKYNKKLI